MEFAKTHGPKIAIGAAATLITMAVASGRGNVAKVGAALVFSTIAVVIATKV